MKKWNPAPREAVKAFETATTGLAGAEPKKDVRLLLCLYERKYVYGVT